MELSDDQLTKLLFLIKNIDYKVIDCFDIDSEMDVFLTELRLSILNDYIKYFVIVDSEPFFYEQNIAKFDKYKDKIIHLKLTNEQKKDGLSPYIAFRAALKIMIEDNSTGVLLDDLVILGPAIEIPSLLGLLIAKSYYPAQQTPITLNMMYLQGFMNRMMDYEVAGSVVCPIHLTQTDFAIESILINRDKHPAIENAGYRYELENFELTKSEKMLKKEYLPSFIEENWERCKEYCYYE